MHNLQAMGIVWQQCRGDDYPANLVKPIGHRHSVRSPFPRKWIKPKGSHIRVLAKTLLTVGVNQCNAPNNARRPEQISLQNLEEEEDEEGGWRTILTHYWSIYFIQFSISFHFIAEEDPIHI